MFKISKSLKETNAYILTLSAKLDSSTIVVQTETVYNLGYSSFLFLYFPINALLLPNAFGLLLSRHWPTVPDLTDFEFWPKRNFKHGEDSKKSYIKTSPKHCKGMHKCMFPHIKPSNYYLNACLNYQLTIFGRKIIRPPASFLLKRSVYTYRLLVIQVNSIEN